VRRPFLLLAAVACAGCGGHTEQKLSLGGLGQTVLQPRDLPAFEQFADNAQTASDAHAGPRNDPTRFGRTGGWIARYHRTTSVPKGPLVVESRTDLFPSSGDAGKDLDAYRDEYAGYPGSRVTGRPQVGDDAVAYTFGSGSDRFAIVAWRFANATASVLVEGLSLDVAVATKFARIQQRRLQRAAA
jgi:hypothetical protein